MKLGAFSVSLSVKNLEESKNFYTKLGFNIMGGSMEQNYLIMKNEGTIIGLFNGMFEGNLLTFNPGWDSNGNNLEEFEDIRSLQEQLKKNQVAFISEASTDTEGPANFMIQDPDGNIILVDQHR